MDGIKIDVIGNVARVIERPARITSGTVGLPIEFTFDEQWEGLSKTAVFRGSGITKIVDILDSAAIVPWEVLRKPNTYLHVGVYGTNSDGTVVITTIWTNVQGIFKGVNPDGDPSTDPTLPVWQKLLNEVGDLSELETGNKNDLVEAINEAHNIAIAGGIETDATLTKEGKAAEAKATGDAIKELQRVSEEVVNTHVGNKDNPHGVTAYQIGLGNADNTSDVDKPVSKAQAKAIADAKKAGTDAQSAVNNHTADTGNPHGVTAAQVGARPNTWMPTASEVGARPNTWMPSAQEVGAVTAAYVTSYVTDYVPKAINDALGVIENGTY